MTAARRGSTRSGWAEAITLDVTRLSDERSAIILSFGDKRTASFFDGTFVKDFQGIASQAERRLAVLNVARDMRDLAALRGNRLEALKGDRQGKFSIRINDQWRICFEWPAGGQGPLNVEIVDYH